MNPLKVLIVEDFLKDISGHWYEYSQSVINICSRNGFKISIATHRDFDRNLINNAEVLPVFVNRIGERRYKKREIFAKLLNILHHNISYYKTLRSILITGDFGFIFFPSPVPNYHFIPILLLLGKTHSNSSFLLLIRQDIADQKGRFHPKTIVNSFLLYLYFKFFKNNQKLGRVIFFSDSEGLGESYKKFSELPFQILPIPHIRHTRKAGVIKNNNRIVISSLGSARFEKGTDIVLSAIDSFLNKNEGKIYQFIIQITDGRDFGSDFDALIKNLGSKENVSLLRHPLTSQEYDEVLLQSDLILLPYRKSAYLNRTSGIAIEAMAAGVPVVYTKGTWIETAVRDYGAGLGVLDGSTEDLMRILEILPDRLRGLKTEAIKKSKSCLDFHSSYNFFSILFKRKPILITN